MSLNTSKFFSLCNFYCNRAFGSRICTNFASSYCTMGEESVEKSILKKLKTSFNPIHLSVVNESYMHNVPKGSETHFKVLIVSEKFENVTLLNRYRLVNSLLEEELKNGVHALSIVAKAPSQWDQNKKVTPSPACQGGFGK